MTISRTAATALLFVASLAPALGAEDGERRVPPRERAGASSHYQYYPEKTEGGVSGNLPFNNQIRKHTDPLNANGAR